jgi:hypothetical protein
VGRVFALAGASKSPDHIGEVQDAHVWLKLQSLAEGARRASAQLWAKPES